MVQGGIGDQNRQYGKGVTGVTAEGIGYGKSLVTKTLELSLN